MKILFLGDIVGNSGCDAVKKYLPKKKETKDLVMILFLFPMVTPKLLEN